MCCKFAKSQWQSHCPPTQDIQPPLPEKNQVLAQVRGRLGWTKIRPICSPHWICACTNTLKTEGFQSGISWVIPVYLVISLVNISHLKVVREIMRDERFKGHQNFSFEACLQDDGQRVFGVGGCPKLTPGCEAPMTLRPIWSPSVFQHLSGAQVASHGAHGS